MPDDNIEILFKALEKNIELSNEALKKELHYSLKGIRHHIDANGEVIDGQLEKIAEKQDISNGRLETLEKETSWWRFFQRNPKLTLFTTFVFIIGIAVLIGINVNSDKIVEIFDHLKFW